MNYVVYALAIFALYNNLTNTGPDNELRALTKVHNSSGRLIKE
jgi:hypothetical protein